jgi:hypothetical protein
MQNNLQFVSCSVNITTKVCHNVEEIRIVLASSGKARAALNFVSTEGFDRPGRVGNRHVLSNSTAAAIVGRSIPAQPTMASALMFLQLFSIYIRYKDERT